MEEEVGSGGKTPPWVVDQNSMMQKMMNMITEVQGSMNEIKDEIAQITFQAGVAQAIAEEAMEKVDDLEERFQKKLSVLESIIPNEDTVRKLNSEQCTKFFANTPSLWFAGYAGCKRTAPGRSRSAAPRR